MLSNWLSESVTDSDWTSVEDLLNLFLELPVTVDLLRQNQTPKVIKLLSKRDDASYSELESQEKWCVLSLSVFSFF